MTFGGVARATREQRQGAIEALQERLRAEELRACSGELDRQREAIQAAADRIDRRARCELSPDPAGSFQEQRHRMSRGQRLERVLTLPGDPQRRSARHDHTEPVGSGEERCKVGRSGGEVLEIVE